MAQFETFEDVLEGIVALHLPWRLTEDGQVRSGVDGVPYSWCPLEVLVEAYGGGYRGRIAPFVVTERVWKAADHAMFAIPADRAALLLACGLTEAS